MKYGCRTCKKVVTPKNGRLICCGYNEPVRNVKKPSPDKCRDCGGWFRGVLSSEPDFACYCRDAMGDYNDYDDDRDW